MDGLQQGVRLDLTATLEGVGGQGGGGQPFLDRSAHLLDQAFQHTHLAGQGVGARQGAGLNGLGQFGQSALGRLHRIGQQPVGLAHLADLQTQGATVGHAGDEGVEAGHDPQRAQHPGRARAAAQTGAPDRRPDGQGEEQVAEEQEAAGDLSHGAGQNRLSL